MNCPAPAASIMAFPTCQACKRAEAPTHDYSHSGSTSRDLLGDRSVNPRLDPDDGSHSQVEVCDLDTGCQLALLFKGHNSIRWAPIYIITPDCISFSRSPTFRW